MIGQTISHYIIQEKLGEGGMGVVYKAHDTKLDRDVALKFLPLHMTAPSGEEACLLREARAASALNHPHICTIHDIAEHECRQYIVMECIEGKTLREMVPIHTMQAAVEYAIQIGEALHEAHSKGIVHHDVKTDNIMVNSKDQIKVMDFGLAKLKESMKLTKTVTAAGTLAYMSPEQIQDGEVDARSDIFSFGVVFYEMLTGHTPFRGDHEAAMMYSIVNEEPGPVQKYVPDAPSELIHILNRALEKEPGERYQSVDEMVIDLRRLKKGSGRVPQPIKAIQGPSGLNRNPLMRSSADDSQPLQKRTVIVMVGIFALLCTIAAIVLFPHGVHLNPEMKFRTLQVPYRSVWYADISRDGNWLVFPASNDQGTYDVYMMNIAQGQARRVTSDSANYVLDVSISPDAGTIIYSRRRALGLPFELVSVSSFGGTPRVIIENARMAHWRPDGERIGYMVRTYLSSGRFTHEMWTAKPDGSDRRFMFADTLENITPLRASFCWSPDMRSIAWTKDDAGGSAEIIIHELETGKERQLTFDKKTAYDPVWTQNGYIIFSSNRTGNVNLWIVPSSGGELVQLTRGSGPDAPVWVSGDCTRMIYSEAQRLGHIKLGDLRTGTVRQLTVDDRRRLSPAISPSGAFIAFEAQEEDEYSIKKDIYVMDRTGAGVRKVTEGPEIKSRAFWSTDEVWLTYHAYHPTEPPESSRIYLLNMRNPGQPRSIGRGDVAYWFNPREFILWRSQKPYLGSIDRTDLVPFAEDSVWACPILGRKYIVAFDYRGGGARMLITTRQAYQAAGIASAKQIARVPKMGIASPQQTTQVPIEGNCLAEDGRYFFYTEQGPSRSLHRISLPDGRDERIPYTFPGLANDFSVRYDGKEIVYNEYTRKARFVIIDHLFK